MKQLDSVLTCNTEFFQTINIFGAKGKLVDRFIEKIFNFYNCYLKFIKQKIGGNVLFKKIKTLFEQMSPFVSGKIPRENYAEAISIYFTKYGDKLRTKIKKFLEILANNNWREGKTKENIKGEFENLIKIFGEFTNIFNIEQKGVDQPEKVTIKSDNDEVEKKIKLIQPKEFEDFHKGIKEDFKNIFNSLKNYLSVINPKNNRNFGQAKSSIAQNFFKKPSTLLRLKRASPSGSRSSRSGYGSSPGSKSKTIIHNHYYGNSDLADFFFALVLVGGTGWLRLNFFVSKYILWEMDCSRILCIPGPRREKIERELKNRELIHGELNNGYSNNDEESNIDEICPYVSSEIGNETFIQMIKNKRFSIKNKCIAKKKDFGKKMSEFGKSVYKALKNCGPYIALGWYICNIIGIIFIFVISGIYFL